MTDADTRLCGDCPPADYSTDATRCAECPRRAHGTTTTDADTLTRAAELLDDAVWSIASKHDPTTCEVRNLSARLREMAATDQSARIAELEEAVKYWLVVDMERQARITELENLISAHQIRPRGKSEAPQMVAAYQRIADLEQQRDRLREALSTWDRADKCNENSVTGRSEQAHLTYLARDLTAEALKETGK